MIINPKFWTHFFWKKIFLSQLYRKSKRKRGTPILEKVLSGDLDGLYVVAYKKELVEKILYVNEYKTSWDLKKGDFWGVGVG